MRPYDAPRLMIAELLPDRPRLPPINSVIRLTTPIRLMMLILVFHFSLCLPRQPRRHAGICTAFVLAPDRLLPATSDFSPPVVSPKLFIAGVLSAFCPCWRVFCKAVVAAGATLIYALALNSRDAGIVDILLTTKMTLSLFPRNFSIYLNARVVSRRRANLRMLLVYKDFDVTLHDIAFSTPQDDA